MLNHFNRPILSSTRSQRMKSSLSSEKNNIGVIVYSPIVSGLLSGKMTRQRIMNFPDNDWRKN